LGVVAPEAGSYRFGIEVAVEPGEAVVGLGLHAPLLGETSYLQLRAVVPPGS